MPKTRNAFAFRNFDEERILQRPYFKDFGFSAELTDAEIIQSLNVADSDSVDDMEKKLSTIKALQERGKKFYELIDRHMARREKYIKDKEKENRGRIEYLDSQMMLEIMVLHELYKKYHEVNEKIQKKFLSLFSARLRTFIKRSGQTQKVVGDKAQISPTAMSNYVAGIRELSLYSLVRLSKVLGVSTDRLLGLE